MRCLLLLILLGTSALYAQEQPTFEKKIVKGEDGTVYWPLSLPVYVQLSSLPDKRDATMLTNVTDESMKAFANPMKWDGPGIHFIRHLDKENTTLRHMEISFPVSVDGAPPVTTLTLKGAVKYVGSKIYFGKNLVASLDGVDDMSGIGATEYSVNTLPYTISVTDFPFNHELEYSLKYFSADRVGNVEVPKEKVFTVDITAPTTTHRTTTDQLDGKILSPRTLLTLVGEDHLSGVAKTEYYFDSKKPVTYSGKSSLAGLPDGEHTLNYFSTDHVSNREDNNLYSFYLDAKAPEVNSALDSNFVNVKGRTFIAKATTVQLSATDNKAGVKEIYYTINGGPLTLYKTPFVLPQKQGAYSVKFKGVDNVNNTSSLATNDQLSNMFVDDTPPKLAHFITHPKIYTRDTLFITQESGISLTSTDLESGSALITYSLDKITPSSYQQSFKVSAEGKHDVFYTGYDMVNNKTAKSFFFVVDNTAPEIFWHMSLDKIATQKPSNQTKELPVYASGTALYLAATDKLVGTQAIYYSLNGKPELLYTKPIKLSDVGAYTLKIIALDYLGNKNSSDVIEFIVQ